MTTEEMQKQIESMIPTPNQIVESINKKRGPNMERETAMKILKELHDNSLFSNRIALETLIPELADSNDERIRKALLEMVHDTTGDELWVDYNVHKEEALAWLEKQKVADEEIIFRPAAGTDIRIAAKQAFEKIEIGKEVVLAFNGAYIPVNGKTVGEIDSEYDAWLEKQGESYTKKDVDDAYLKGICDAKHELEKQGEQKPILDFKASNFYVSKVDGKIHDMTYNPADKVEPRFKVKYAGSEYNVLEVKDIAGVTFYGIEDEPNHIDYVKAENCEIISGYAIKENGSPYPTKPAAWSDEDENMAEDLIKGFQSPGKAHHLVHISKEIADWLKSLKDRIICKNTI